MLALSVIKDTTSVLVSMMTKDSRLAGAVIRTLSAAATNAAERVVADTAAAASSATLCLLTTCSPKYLFWPAGERASRAADWWSRRRRGVDQ